MGAVYADEDDMSKPQRQLDGMGYSEMCLGRAQASENSYGSYAEFLSLPLLSLKPIGRCTGADTHPA